MTTDRGRRPAATAAQAAPIRGRRRPRQAPAARALATGIALTATGALVTIMAAGQAPAQVQLQTPPAASAAVAQPSPPTTIVIVHRPASSTAVASAPSAGRAVPATRTVNRTPAPVATSSAS